MAKIENDGEEPKKRVGLRVSYWGGSGFFECDTYEVRDGVLALKKNDKIVMSFSLANTVSWKAETVGG